MYRWQMFLAYYLMLTVTRGATFFNCFADFKFFAEAFFAEPFFVAISFPPYNTALNRSTRWSVHESCRFTNYFVNFRETGLF